MKAEMNCGDEWPQVGDEVEFKPNPSKDDWVKASIEYIGDKFTILKSDTGREFSRRNSKLALRKPKTPEEELRDNIVQLIDDADGLSSHVLALALMDKYDIKKKPQQEAST